MAELEIDGVGFYMSWQNQSTADRFVLLKYDEAMERHLDLLRRHSGGRILDIGIYQGGSAALAMLVADPAKLVAIDVAEPVDALETFRTERGFEDRLRTYYRCDQGDRERLTQILDDELGDEQLDLVVDDASHLYDETLTSFEVAFPRLRPGGEFVIEDWVLGPQAAVGITDLIAEDGEIDETLAGWSSLIASGAHEGTLVHGPTTDALLRAIAAGGASAERAKAAIEKHEWPLDNRRPKPLAALTAALAAVVATRPGEIERVELHQDLITVIRGSSELPRTGWRLERHPCEATELLGLAPPP